ncbi:iron-sulfur cluster assembly scaffold protein [Alkalicaulis satelles]|uniref:Iron-sulfur cluster assembly scaffold protein n=1 Tax=Alkalicaulis satelles TaxID=2609175 RepID=A0A5M6ZKT9_9PROT|nr:iron-sulfur cluster assembly scaffold protein [Alkalicaulis satelles]KAA5805446.1 iron-sulfur cluster assembly scaffold protein [Alkalicaulis satelles]
MTSDPYSPDLIALAADIPHIGRLTAPHASVRKVSRICGSELDLDICLENGAISALGLEVRACALGQASASVFARNAIGATLDDVRAARDGLKAMLQEGANPPQGRFAALSAVEGARAYRQRHGSILLAFDAGVDAMEAGCVRAS